ncbi:unnamed protein product [Adineta steineri]|uniref:Uncharacterized protein n=1 Tax=Adineta steineri TaxID=433720 RepID=A0A819EKK4_9BILA|nr:unnamed protein product [Adineta steineri]
MNRIFYICLVLATTGSKMSATLQVMHQKKENVGVLGRINMWHLSSSGEFNPPKFSKLIPDIASIDHLLIIAHQLFAYSPEFRFQKYISDVTSINLDDEEDEYMKALRSKQGIVSNNNLSNSSISEDEYRHDIVYPRPEDLTNDDSSISAHKLMNSILDSEFKIAQQMDEHLVECVPKSTYKFPRTCSLLCVLEIIGEIASNLLKYIVFDEGNFSRPHSSSNKFISVDFVLAAHQYVANYITTLPKIEGRPIIYINKLQVERAFHFYVYVETTTKILFDASLINSTSQIGQDTNLTNQLSKQEKQEISWIIKVLKTPVLFFSNNYICKSTPGCPGSGIMKNASTELRNRILNSMTTYGLVTCDKYLSSMKLNSFVKVPPNVVRQNDTLVKLFNMFGAALTLNNYEKLFENFSLVTAANASIVPVTSTGIKLLRENNAYVNYYHCLDKDEGILNMIQERLNLKEICRISDNKNGPYRYELVNINKNIIHILPDHVHDNDSERIGNDAQITSVTSTINLLEHAISSIDKITQEKQQSNVLLPINRIADGNPKEIVSIIVEDKDDNNLLFSEIPNHSTVHHQVQRQLSTESSISISSQASSSNISSVDCHISPQHSTLSSSSLSSILFKEVLNINKSLNMNSTPIDDLSTIMEEENSSPSSNNIANNSSIHLECLSPITSTTETPQFTTQPFEPTKVSTDVTLSNNRRPDIVEQNDSLQGVTDIEANKSCPSHSTMIVETISSNCQDPVDLTTPLLSTEVQSNNDISEYNSLNTSPVCLSFDNCDTSIESLPNSSSTTVVKKKRGRKPTLATHRTSSPIDDIQNVLTNCKHPIYKRLILLDGMVFSKSDLTHAVQQFSNLRDIVIQKLITEKIFKNEDVFAKRTASGDIEYLVGYIKHSPVNDIDISSNIDECIRFANVLAGYDITMEEYVNSFHGKQSFLQNDDDQPVKYILDRSHIKLSSYLFSSKFVNFINNDNYFRERYTIDDSAICLDRSFLAPTTSNTRIDEFQQMQYDQLKKCQANKRAYTQIKDNAGPAPKNSRRRT